MRGRKRKSPSIAADGTMTAPVTVGGEEKDSLYISVQNLRSAVSKSLESDEYCDLTLQCQGKVMRCHKMILCGASHFFAKCVQDQRFKEGHTGVVLMDEDHPNVILAMLSFVYGSSYQYGDKGPNIPGGSNRFFQELKAQEVTEHPMLFNLHVYALAEKIQLAGLKSVALRKFKILAASDWDTDTFITAIRTVYEITLSGPTGKDLREVVVNLAGQNYTALKEKREGFNDLLAELAEFTGDAAAFLAKENARLKRKFDQTGPGNKTASPKPK